MRLFKYVHDLQEITAFGILFKQGVPVPLEDPFICGKLAGNKHFKEEAADIDTVEFTETPKKTRNSK